MESLKSKIGEYKDFPKKGIIFRDVFSLLKDPSDFSLLMKKLEDEISVKCPDVEAIVGLESRGFLFGPSLALKFKVPFVPIRKGGKLPGPVNKIEFDLEYGKDTFEIQENSIAPGKKVVIVDDLIATGGTIKAAEELISNVGGNVSFCLVVIELLELNGRKKMKAPLASLFSF